LPVGINPRFYNRTKQTPNGFDSTGIEFSIERRLRLSEANKGKKHSEETKRKMSIAGKGKQKTKEHLENARIASMISRQLNPVKFSQETIEKRRLSNIGQKRTEEQRERISKALIGKKRTKEQNIRNGVSRTGIRNSFFLGYYVTPEFITDSRKELESVNMCRKWCINSYRIISKSSYTRSKYLKNNYSLEFLQNKSFSDIGFGFIHKDDFCLLK